MLGTNGTITTPDFGTSITNYIRTIEFRIQTALADIAANESQGVFIKGFSSNLFQNYSHQCTLTRDASGTGGVLRLYLGISVVSAPSSVLTIPISDLSQNNHIAFTQRGNGGNGVYAGYLNGTLITTSGFVQNYTTNTYAIDIGVSVYNWVTSTQTNKFKGRLDNFRISNVDRYPTAFTPPT